MRKHGTQSWKANAAIAAMLVRPPKDLPGRMWKGSFQEEMFRKQPDCLRNLFILKEMAGETSVAPWGINELAYCFYEASRPRGHI